jgi:chitinase
MAALLGTGCSGDDEPAAAAPPPPPLPTNAAPTVRAGGNQNVVAGATVRLDGTASTDPDGNPLTYRWTLIARPTGSSAQLTGAGTASPSFVADLIGSYTAALVVNDGALDSTTGLVTVAASLGNVAPVARVGVDQTTIPGATVTVDGSASSDANGDPLSFAWSLVGRPAGSTAALASTTADSTTFVPDLVGSYTLNLEVSDGTLTNLSRALVVTVVNANVPPVADAGPARRVLTGSTVTLDGSRSRDPNGDPLNHVWSLVSRPAGSAASLPSRTGTTTSLLADVEGIYVVGLVVNDGNSDSAAVTVAISAFNLNPLPAGAGTWAQARTGLAFSNIDESTGAATAAADGCARLVAADAQPDGTVLGVTGGSTVLTVVDVRSGVCRAGFTVAEPMVALAVAADGVVHLLSQAAAAGGAGQLYRYAADGRLLGQVGVSGSSGGATPVALLQPEAMDFAPDGSLLLVQAGALWQVSPSSGVGTLRFAGLASSGDIDIDAAGQLRSIDGGQLRVVDAGTGAAVRSVPLQPNSFGPSALVRR